MTASFVTIHQSRSTLIDPPRYSCLCHIAAPTRRRRSAGSRPPVPSAQSNSTPRRASFLRRSRVKSRPAARPGPLARRGRPYAVRGERSRVPARVGRHKIGLPPYVVEVPPRLDEEGIDAAGADQVGHRLTVRGVRDEGVSEKATDRSAGQNGNPHGGRSGPSPRGRAVPRLQERYADTVSGAFQPASYRTRSRSSGKPATISPFVTV